MQKLYSNKTVIFIVMFTSLMSMASCDGNSDMDKKDATQQSATQQPVNLDSIDTPQVEQEASCDSEDCGRQANEFVGKTCKLDGYSYKVGEKLPNTDSCNDCVCGENGVICTQRICDQDASVDGDQQEPSICEQCLSGVKLEICATIRCAYQD